MSPSLPSTDASSGLDAAPRLALVIVVAPVGALLGRALHVDDARVLGREDPLFTDVSRSLSRRHAVVRHVAEGLVVRDLGSRFGTFLNGERLAASAPLVAGDRLLLGKVGFVARLVDASAGARPAPPHARLAQDARTALEAGAMLHLFGPAGAGKRTLVRSIHEGGALSGPVITISSTADLDALDASAATVCFADLDEAGPEVVSACAALLRERARGRSGPRLVVTTAAGPEVAWPAELGGLATSARVRMLALSERPELALTIAAARAERTAGTALTLTPRLSMHLVGEPSAGTANDLEAYVDWLVGRRALRADTAPELDLPEERDDGDELHVEPGGAAFRARGSGTVRLGRRPILCAILEALTDASRRGAALDVDALARIAWPGELMSTDSRAARVHTAIATLRRLGLSAHLTRGEDGYRLVRLASDSVGETRGRGEP